MMPHEKLEGTVVLDGMVQGKIPPTADGLVGLREWNAKARAAGLRFALEIEGNLFNLLPDDQAFTVQSLGPAGAEAITDRLQELLDLYPPAAACQVLSTVRSREYRENTEVQTLYAVGPDGRIHTRESVTPTRTVKPPPPLTRKDRVKMVLIALVFALAVFAVASLFVDFRGMIRKSVDDFRPIDTQKIAVDASRFDRYFAVTARTVRKGNVALTLKRTTTYPADDAAADRASRAATSLPDRLAVDALARGWVLCEMWDAEDTLIGSVAVRIADLRKEETCVIELPVVRGRRLTRVVLNY